MTEAECWEALEDHLRSGSKVGFLVIADRFQELGREPLAKTIRRFVESGGHHAVHFNPKAITLYLEGASVSAWTLQEAFCLLTWEVIWLKGKIR